MRSPSWRWPICGESRPGPDRTLTSRKPALNTATPAVAEGPGVEVGPGVALDGFGELAVPVGVGLLRVDGPERTPHSQRLTRLTIHCLARFLQRQFDREGHDNPRTGIASAIPLAPTFRCVQPTRRRCGPVTASPYPRRRLNKPRRPRAGVETESGRGRLRASSLSISSWYGRPIIVRASHSR
jgi:hypothetical protein